MGTWNNVQPGDVICVDGSALSGGKLKSKTYISVNGGAAVKFYTNCSKVMLGDTQGDLSLTSYTDKMGAICSADAPPICDCSGKITDLRLTYVGPSGADIKVYSNNNHSTLLLSLTGVNTFDPINLSNAAGLPGKIYIEIVGSNQPDVKMDLKCKKLFVGDRFWFFDVAAWKDQAGTSCPSGVLKGETTTSAGSIETNLSAYPNPFSSSTTVEFTVTEATSANVTVYNLTGEVVAVLFNGQTEAGAAYKLQFRPEGVASGIYIAKLTTSSGVVKSEKLVLNR
jgi:hypothetical protein